MYLMHSAIEPWPLHSGIGLWSETSIQDNRKAFINWQVFLSAEDSRFTFQVLSCLCMQLLTMGFSHTSWRMLCLAWGVFLVCIQIICQANLKGSTKLGSPECEAP